MNLIPMQTFRGFPGLKESVKIVEGTLYNGNFVAPFFDIVSAILGVIFVVFLVKNVARQQKGGEHSQEALMKVGGSLIGAILMLEVIKILFFK